MNFWDRITGNDLSRQWKQQDARIRRLPRDYQQVWAQLGAELWQRSDFSGRKILAVLDGVLNLFEETSASGRSAQEALGADIKDFCAELAGDIGTKTYRDRWRDQLNRSVMRRLGR